VGGVDDVGGDGEAAVEIFDVGVWSRGLSDAQTSVALGWQNDGADLVGLPRGVDALLEERLFDASQQMICKHTKKNMAVNISAASLGGTETLITHPASMIFSHQSLDQLSAVGIEPGLLRLSVGLEHYQDIVDDLTYALPGTGDRSERRELHGLEDS
jgi:hypothetical protein